MMSHIDATHNSRHKKHHHLRKCRCQLLLQQLLRFKIPQQPGQRQQADRLAQEVAQAGVRQRRPLPREVHLETE